MFGAIAFLPLFVQKALGQSATNSGLVITPMMVGFMISSIIGGQLLSRTGRYKILALVGFTVAAIGMYMLSRMTVATSTGELVRDMIITGLGIGVMMSLFTIVVQNAFPFRQLGEVTATLSFFRQMGSTMGLAIFGVILSNTLVSNLQANLPAPLKPFASQLTQLSPTGGSTSGLPPALLQALAQLGPQAQVMIQQVEHVIIPTSLADSITHIFLLGSGLMVVCFVVTLFLKEIPLRKSNKPSEGASSPALEAEVEVEEAIATFGM
jgi:MFS family permease